MIELQNIIRFSYLLLFFGLIGCQETDWKETYKEKSKEPFGLYILHNEFESLTGNYKKDLKQNFYDYCSIESFDNHLDIEPQKSTENKIYVCIKDYLLKLDDDGIDALNSFVYNGNTAFISCNAFPSHLEETLDFKTILSARDTTNLSTELKDSKTTFRLKNNNFKKKRFDYDEYVNTRYFNKIDNNTTVVLGTSEVGDEAQPNFIKIHHGNGIFYIHSNPVAFSNYYLLKGKEAYVENVLSYLPEGEVLWDLQIKSSTINKRKDRDGSAFKFFLEHKTLTWFLFVSFTGLLLFMLFNARRKQRPIPIIKPLENTTVSFVQTISSLYLKEQDHTNLADKKIKFFLEQVRAKYLLETNNLNTKFIENLALKSGNDLQKTKYLIHSIIAINKKTECSEEELIVLYRMIENFFKK